MKRKANNSFTLIHIQVILKKLSFLGPFRPRFLKPYLLSSQKSRDVICRRSTNKNVFLRKNDIICGFCDNNRQGSSINDVMVERRVQYFVTIVINTVIMGDGIAEKMQKICSFFYEHTPSGKKICVKGRK